MEEEKDGASLHAQSLTLEYAVLITCNSSDRGLAVGVNVQLEAKGIHCESSHDGLELCRVHPSGAADAGARESGSDGVSGCE